ncbi:uncharacterized protein YjiS (DUF1127 family) [Pseudomonas nitritireducens]|uniref:Uncharacterized protein YjiS (DUF1127 family) n=1 Tax=Pseudomonas nitroreducens TaxID=46680 RepID=A0A7W7KNY1_PSENT|nr:hypothetical protein [Pseudomonas nitritireducens]MBB4866282.1 uncharacterized protein YjiS (DUF1127 family) [Pseudomonas nitritireducens]
MNHSAMTTKRMEISSTPLLRQAPPLRPSPAALRQWIALWQARAQLRRQLARMARANPHLIADIGLTREQVAAEIAKPFWRV